MKKRWVSLSHCSVLRHQLLTACITTSPSPQSLSEHKIWAPGRDSPPQHRYSWCVRWSPVIPEAALVLATSQCSGISMVTGCASRGSPEQPPSHPAVPTLPWAQRSLHKAQASFLLAPWSWQSLFPKALCHSPSTSNPACSWFSFFFPYRHVNRIKRDTLAFPSSQTT